jgi:hypothetical protein
MGSANSNIVSITFPKVNGLSSVQAGADFLGGNTSAFSPPTGNSVEDIQTGNDFLGGTLTAIDPDFANVLLLLHMDGTNGSTAFPDSSSNNLPVTAHGTAAVTTSAPEFGTGALLIGTNTDNVQTPCNAGGVLDLSDTDFTIEGWINVQQSLASQVLFEIGSGSGYLDGGLMLYTTSSLGGELQAQIVLTDTIAAGATAVPIANNTWAAVALVRSAGQFFLFLNGVGQAFAGVVDHNKIKWPGGFLKIGAGFFTNSQVGNKFDEWRVSKEARYTSNYTPIGPFPNS